MRAAIDHSAADRRAFGWVLWVSMLTAPSCIHEALDLAGLPCKDGVCLEGYACHPETLVCEPAISIDCSGAGICPSQTATGDSCPSAGSFLPCDDTVTDCRFGCRTCSADLTWSACTAGTCCRLSDTRVCDAGGGPASGTQTCGASCDWGNCVPVPDVTPPRVVVNLTCTPGDGQVSCSWTYPSDSDLAECVIQGRTDRYPNSETDGTQVADLTSPAPGGPGNATDVSLINGTLYYYVIFCRDLSMNWQTVVTFGNRESAMPLAPASTITDFVATSGEDAQATLSFTVPGSVDDCAVMRKLGGYPTSHSDAAAASVAGPYLPGGQVQVDAPLTNGSLYYYAAFCRTGVSWDDRVSGGNIGRAQPMAAIADFVASDGGDTFSVLTFTAPAGAAVCRVVRTTGGYPSGPNDGVLVDEHPLGGSGTFTAYDVSIANGVTYYYAAFCRIDAVYRNVLVTPGGNADTAVGSPAPPGIAFDNGDSGEEDGPIVNLDWGHVCLGTKLLLLVSVAITTDAGQQVAQVSYSPATGPAEVLALVDAIELPGKQRLEMWSLVAPSPGSGRVNLTLTAPADVVGGSVSLRGVDQAVPIEASNLATGTGTRPQISLATLTAGAWVVDAVGYALLSAGTPTASADPGQTQQWSNISNSGRSKGSTLGPVTPAGNVTMAWTLSSGVDWAIGAIAVKPAP